MKNLIQAFKSHRFLFYYLMSYMAVILIVAYMLGGKTEEVLNVLSFFTANSVFLFFFGMIMLVIVLIRAMLGARAKTPFGWVSSVLGNFENSVTAYCSDGRLSAGFMGLLALIPLNIGFCIGKSLIPTLTEYNWDPLFSNIDRILHFGHYPHDLLGASIINDARDVVLVDQLYLMWFLMMFLVQGYAIFADHNAIRRMRFLWALALSWPVMGLGLATLLASVGPLFYHDFYPGVSPYADLIAHLASIHKDTELHAVQIAGALSEEVRNESVIGLNAISAMPSMHVAMAWLAVIYAWNINRFVWGAAVLFHLAILAGSIYLGWHYAIDGYAGMLAIWGIWRLTRPLVRKLHPEYAD